MNALLFLSVESWFNERWCPLQPRDLYVSIHLAISKVVLAWWQLSQLLPLLAASLIKTHSGFTSPALSALTARPRLLSSSSLTLTSFHQSTRDPQSSLHLTLSFASAHRIFVCATALSAMMKGSCALICQYYKWGTASHDLSSHDPCSCPSWHSPVAVAAFEWLCSSVLPEVSGKLIAPCKAPFTAFPWTPVRLLTWKEIHVRYSSGDVLFDRPCDLWPHCPS